MSQPPSDDRDAEAADDAGLVDPTTTASPTSYWPGLQDTEHSAWYVQRFRVMATLGEDMHGESRLMDVLAPRGARLLDAGSGPGRHGGHLARLGHRVVGVDIDPVLIAAAREDHPDATWLVGDLVTLDLAAQGEREPFDGVLLAGNVMDFIPQEHRATALARVAAHVRPGGFVLVGCRTVRGFTPEELDAALPAAGLRLEHRFGTWDLAPWDPASTYFVSVLRKDG
ncbi:class I SAM-dependent methyltransferase [Ornithinimicrobium tianjinense]|nr:class I SAM-dependent methyltransferase [Ornithinimicrobium tianjinense]